MYPMREKSRIQVKKNRWDIGFSPSCDSGVSGHIEQFLLDHLGLLHLK